MSISSSVKDITFTSREMTVHFSDGRKITTPLAWYPRLLNATKAQRGQWRILGKDRGIHWPKVDEDLSIEGILHGIPSVEYQTGEAPRSLMISKNTRRVSRMQHETRV